MTPLLNEWTGEVYFGGKYESQILVPLGLGVEGATEVNQWHVLPHFLMVSMYLVKALTGQNQFAEGRSSVRATFMFGEGYPYSQVDTLFFSNEDSGQKVVGESWSKSSKQKAPSQLQQNSIQTRAFQLSGLEESLIKFLPCFISFGVMHILFLRYSGWRPWQLCKALTLNK